MVISRYQTFPFRKILLKTSDQKRKWDSKLDFFENLKPDVGLLKSSEFAVVIGYQNEFSYHMCTFWNIDTVFGLAFP